jgi:hypothetical protein
MKIVIYSVAAAIALHNEELVCEHEVYTTREEAEAKVESMLKLFDLRPDVEDIDEYEKTPEADGGYRIHATDTNKEEFDIVLKVTEIEAVEYIL